MTDQTNPPSLEDLFEQLAALRTEVAQLRANFTDAKREGVEQVDRLDTRLDASIDQMTRKLAACHADIWAVRVDLEKKLEDVTRAMRRW